MLPAMLGNDCSENVFPGFLVGQAHFNGYCEPAYMDHTVSLQHELQSALCNYHATAQVQPDHSASVTWEMKHHERIEKLRSVHWET